MSTKVRRRCYNIDTIEHLVRGDDCIFQSPQTIEYVKNLVKYVVQVVHNEMYGMSRCEVYEGSAGILYCLHRLNKHIEIEESFVSTLLERMERMRSNRMSFLCGKPGVLAIVAAITTTENANVYVERMFEYAPTLNYPTEPCEIMYGIVGWIYALQFVLNRVQNSITPDIVKRIQDSVLECCEYVWQCGLQPSGERVYLWHNSQYLGAAHGTTGIIFTLLGQNEWALRNKAELVRTIERLITKKFQSGNFATRNDTDLSDSDNDRLVQWCHGAPALCLLLCRAIATFPSYAPSWICEAEKCGDVIWKYGLLKKGPGLCHGVSGNAYCFLYLYQVSKRVIWLQRAWAFAMFMIGIHDNPNACASPPPQSLAGLPQFFENPDHPMSLMNGMGGVACFLDDLLRVESGRNLRGIPAFDDTLDCN